MVHTKHVSAQRAKKRVRAIHAKTKSQRKDARHKLSTALVKANAIFVGDVASAKMAKRTVDAGWSMLNNVGIQAFSAYGFDCAV